MLVAAFVMAAIQHLLIWVRHTAVREHLWFGVTSLAVAAAAISDCPECFGVPAPGAASVRHWSFLLAMAWLSATTWFIVEYAGEPRRRLPALLAVVLLAIAGFGDLVSIALGRYNLGGGPQGMLRVPAIVALAIMFGLLADGALRMWRAARWIRTAALGALGTVLSLIALRGIQVGNAGVEISPMILCAFLVVVVIMTYELAGTVTGGEIATQRQRQELAHASRLSIVGELTATIAHEINQPLGAILSNADAGEILLENPDPPLDEIRKILADIRRDGLRASDVIRHVRRLVRRRELELEKLDANAIAADVIALLEPETRRRRISLASVSLPHSAWLRGDRALLEQLLINLILNAMDAVEAVGATGNVPLSDSPVALSISTTTHGEVEFQIVDAGTGIPTERLSHLFDSFYTSKSHGMGLGLSIARSIVEAHGGRIRAENNREGGAKFRVTLPPYDERHE